MRYYPIWVTAHAPSSLFPAQFRHTHEFFNGDIFANCIGFNVDAHLLRMYEVRPHVGASFWIINGASRCLQTAEL